MRQYKYILFKDGKPWKGMYNELDFINEYSHTFEEILKKCESYLTNTSLAKEVATLKFFKKYQPAEWVSMSNGYQSLLGNYIKGETEDEGSVVYDLEWDDMDRKGKILFNYIEQEFKDFLNELNGLRKYDKPAFGVTRGTGALSVL